MTERRGLLIILSSPSGAGKTTLSRRLIAADPLATFSISATTRAPRPGEEDGREYYFRARPAFVNMVETGQMLEHATVFGNYYGSPRAPAEAAISAGRDMLFDVDWQGGQQIRTSALGPDALSIFILPPSLAELERRLRNRAQDSEAEIARRMAESRSEISHWAEYDFVLINDDLDRCYDELTIIIRAERLRLSRRPDLREMVQAMIGTVPQ